jgi:hypothetical protein
MYPNFPFQGLQKLTKNWDFWSENKPSGNPAQKVLLMRVALFVYTMSALGEGRTSWGGRAIYTKQIHVIG